MEVDQFWEVALATGSTAVLGCAAGVFAEGDIEEGDSGDLTDGGEGHEDGGLGELVDPSDGYGEEVDAEEYCERLAD